MLAGSLNAQEKPVEYSNSEVIESHESIENLEDLDAPEPFKADTNDFFIYLYLDEKGKRYALQVDVNEETGAYEYFKHHLTEDDDIYLEKLGLPLKYLPDIKLENPKPSKKSGNLTLRATSFTCPTNLNGTPGSNTINGNNLAIHYNHPARVIYGNAAICKNWTLNPANKTHHRIRYDVAPINYDSQGAHTFTMAKYKFQSGWNHGVGMYFGDAGNPCPTGQYAGQTTRLNTRIEMWWIGGNTDVSMNSTCGKTWGEGYWYRVNLDAYPNPNNNEQMSKYWIKRWENKNGSWVLEPFTDPVTGSHFVSGFDSNAEGVFIGSTLPMVPAHILPTLHSWRVWIKNVQTWWY